MKKKIKFLKTMAISLCLLMMLTFTVFGAKQCIDFVSNTHPNIFTFKALMTYNSGHKITAADVKDAKKMSFPFVLSANKYVKYGTYVYKINNKPVCGGVQKTYVSTKKVNVLRVSNHSCKDSLNPIAPKTHFYYSFYYFK